MGGQANHDLKGVSFPPSTGIPSYALANHFSNWRKTLPDSDNSPVFMVAASGGGLRAAYWTAMLLAGMDDKTCGDFGRHIYSFSGVSGGSLGVALYLGQREIWQQKKLEDRCKPGRKEEMQKFLQRDFLAPTVGSMLFAEGLQSLIPINYLEKDRGSTLALSWERAWDDVYKDQSQSNFLHQPFHAKFGNNASKNIEYTPPAVFFNSTSVTTGRRVIASNININLPGADLLFWGNSDSRGLQLKTYNLPISETVLNSARFTFVSPAGNVYMCHNTNKFSGEIKCNGDKPVIWDRLVDGGYFENSGLETTRDVMEDMLSWTLAEAQIQNPIFIISIGNSTGTHNYCTYSGSRCKTSKGYKNLGDPLNISLENDSKNYGSLKGASTFDEITSPVKALLAVREGRANLEISRMVKKASCHNILEWNLADPREDNKEPALGWFLSINSQNRMDRRVDDYVNDFPFDLCSCAQSVAESRGLISTQTERLASCPNNL